ncbi:SNF2 family N-terminal domain-domain-containing protein [Microdochium bolleyi]|uniref:SNF2 family N-terminal domain-domain-containing protein n=1 Tax=Microdochium bolleyi TaxID=196109 RepID=A0A136J970_9PEZI|nr:SNF2 family N-terminal domain-domain-containing protein [Microdochium bolleyi]
MASSSAFGPTVDTGSAPSIDELQDEIDMQSIFIDSLAGTPADTPARRAELQQGMRDLQRNNGHVNQSRKRTFSVHNGDSAGHDTSGAFKSRRTTPSPGDSDWEDASDVIDLSEITGSDRDFVNRQKAEAERLRRRREQEERDAAFARSLQADPLLAQSSTAQPPRNSQSDGPSAFDRIRQPIFSQSSQRSQGTDPAPVSPVRALPVHHRASPAVPTISSRAITSSHRPKPSRMPGTFDSDGEGFWSDDDAAPSSRAVVDLTDTNDETTNFLSASRASNGFQSAAASAREAALQRQQQGFPSYSSGSTGFAPGSLFTPGVPMYQSGAQFNSAGFPMGSQYPYGSRPGSLVGGSANLFGQSMPNTLASIIDRTSSFDYTNGLDMFGNPLDERIQGYIHDIVDDPRKNEEEIRELLANIRPDMDIPEEDRKDDPAGLRYPLYPHQRIALKWMEDQEEDGKKAGGILADDMGLGKTISTLALIAKTNLIIGPVGLIRQWEREIAKKLKPTHRLSVFLAHGKKFTYDDLRGFDVVLTSYGTIGSEMSKRDKYVREQSKNGSLVDNATLNAMCPMIGPNSTWYRVILDEAQCIKNRKTWAAQAACALQAQYRWCLSGTPMMNSVDELSSLITFLRIKPYHDPKQFRAAFGALTAKSRPSSDSARQRQMTRLQATLKAIMLRRTKASKLNGQPIIQLTEKHEETVHVVFNEDEDKFYRDLEQHSQVQFSKYLKNNTIGKHYTNILALLTRLRQACCHPLLHMMDFSQGGSAEISETVMAQLAESLAPDVVRRIRGTEDFECPICMEAVLNPSIFVPCGHDTCSECLVCLANGSSEQGIRAGNENAKANCPECRGPIDFQKVITFEIFKQVHMPETIKPEPSSAAGGVNDDADGPGDDSGSETASDDESDGSSTASDDDDNDETDDDEVDKKGNLRDFIIDDDVDEDFKNASSDTGADDTGSEVEDIAVALTRNKTRQAISKGKKSKQKKSRRKRKGKGKGKAKEEPVEPHMLKKLRQEAGKNREAHRRYMRYLKEIWEPSAKVTKCMELIADIQKLGEKTIIFSQWTLLLDLLETPLKHELGVGYRRYDGSMSAKQRDGAASDFMERSDVKVILVSLKAGNAGLNLTAASQVIIMDPFWNPYIEMQAVDRAHRIGQQRDVKVHRILVENTIEDRIIEMQNKKRDMVDTALSEEASKSIGRLTAQDLTYLFGIGSGNGNTITSS